VGCVYDTQVTFGRNGLVGFTSGSVWLELLSVLVYTLLLPYMMYMKYK
jgi:hypothetical protein